MSEPGAPAAATIAAARREIARLLRQAGCETPELDARLLVGHATGLDLTSMARDPERRLGDEVAARLATMAQQRIAGTPIARILGEKEFWGLALTLSPATLVPRPDTETLVEAALAAFPVPPQLFADLGTGSGAIALALASHWTSARGVATDVSPEALRTARGNAARHALCARLCFVCCDYASALVDGFDLIVSNPPYICSREIGLLATEVRDHDPHRALDGGPDGLAAYRQLIPQAVPRLREGGVLMVEVGHDQSGPVADLMQAGGLALLPFRNDLGGVARVVSGRKASSQPLGKH